MNLSEISLSKTMNPCQRVGCCSVAAPDLNQKEKIPIVTGTVSYWQQMILHKNAFFISVIPGPRRPEALRCILPLTAPSCERRPARNAAHYPWCSATWGSTGLLTSFGRRPEVWLSDRRWRSCQYLWRGGREFRLSHCVVLMDRLLLWQLCSSSTWRC